MMKINLLSHSHNLFRQCLKENDRLLSYFPFLCFLYAQFWIHSSILEYPFSRDSHVVIDYSVDISPHLLAELRMFYMRTNFWKIFYHIEIQILLKTVIFYYILVKPQFRTLVQNLVILHFLIENLNS
jgi:hypothetical protein